MKLDYEVIEDEYDDTTHIRTMTEQARVPGGGWLLRTTIYSPHQISHSVVNIATSKKKSLYKPIT
ncbi:MAG: hypothetical protein KZQ77_18040 [Candidatus Thiodiazotropha sp. (ex Notomyrtea botanica)]|nr:hypothetical protein [Candidatus Thiodiazotropha sp. (ex Notomyrtea botanica)]